MNTQAMIKLADFIEDVEPDAFNMAVYWTDGPEVKTICGTAGCLAGWQAHIGSNAHYLARIEGAGIMPSYFEFASNDLDLSVRQANMLFTNSEWWANTFVKLGLRDKGWLDEVMYVDLDGWGLNKITHKEAAIVLRAIVDGTIPL